MTAPTMIPGTTSAPAATTTAATTTAATTTAGRAPSAPTRLTAPVTGGRSGSAPLTWGQQAIWKSVVALARQNDWIHLRHLVTVSAGRRLRPEDAARALARLTILHETLRTRFVTSDGGRMQQVLDASGEITLSVRAVPPAPDRPTAFSPLLGVRTALPEPHLRVVDEVLRDRLATPLDPARDWPMWATAVTVDGYVRYLLVVFNHVALDWYASGLVLRDLRMLLAGREAADPAGERPLDLAAREQGDLRRTRRALRHWQDAAAGLAEEQLPVVTPAAGASPYLECLLESSVLGPALDAVAARHGVSTATVAAAAVCGVLGRYTGWPRCGVVIIVDNRFQPGHDAVIAPMSQLGLLALDVRDADPDRPATLHRLVPAAWQASLQAYRNAHYDQAAMDAMLAGTGLGTDADIEPRCCLNDLRAGRPGMAAAGPGGRQAGGPGWPSRVSFRPMTSLNWNLYVEVRDLPDGHVLVCQADTRRIPPDRLEAFTRDIEKYVVGAAAVAAPEEVLP